MSPEEPVAKHPLPWRIGHKVARHVYDADGEPVVTMPTAELALLVVAHANGAPVRRAAEALAEATALLELARDAIDEACYPVWWKRWRAFLSRAPAPAAKPRTQCASPQPSLPLQPVPGLGAGFYEVDVYREPAPAAEPIYGPHERDNPRCGCMLCLAAEGNAARLAPAAEPLAGDKTMPELRAMAEAAYQRAEECKAAEATLAAVREEFERLPSYMSRDSRGPAKYYLKGDVDRVRDLLRAPTPGAKEGGR